MESYWHRPSHGFKLKFKPLILPIFHTFSVNNQDTFISADFKWYKCLALILTCSRMIVYLT